MALEYKMAGYLHDFTCIGGACEDTCCKSWDIRFDKKHYELLHSAVQQEPGDESAIFKQYVKVNDAEIRSERNFALLTLQDNGECPFLLADGWCQLHKKFDVAPLSNICAYFPRVLSRYGNTIEMSGALSCPEMVRQCLFSDKTTELSHFSPSILPRPNDYPLTRELDYPTDEFYYDQFVPVREVLLNLTMLEGFSFSSRLYFLSSLANRLSSFYHHEADSKNQGQLEKELKRAMSLSSLDKLDEFVTKYTAADPVAIIVVQAVLQLRLQNFPGESHSQLVQNILQAYEEQLSHKGSSTACDNISPAEGVWSLFQQQQVTINKHFELELENCLSRYLYNCLYREWFVTMPDPFTYIHMLVIRIAILRFLLYSHPDIIALAKNINSESDINADVAQLRKEVVKVIYMNSRAIDHNMNFLRVIYDAINEQQMMTFEYSLPFIKF